MTLGFIIIGLLSIKPMTGYDLKTFFDRSINFFWSAELSQIYRELSKLEKQGYVSSKIEQQEGRPDKKIYTITEDGERAFLEWLRDFPGNLSPSPRNEFLVRIFFSSRIPGDELIYQLTKYIKHQQEELKTYRETEKQINELMEAGRNGELFYQKLTLRRGLFFVQSEIEWAKECIEELKNRGNVLED